MSQHHMAGELVGGNKLWIGLLEKRAQRSRDLPEPYMARSLGIDLRRFGRVNNATCRDAFVVNVDFHPCKVLELSETELDEIEGKDDFENPVRLLPIGKTTKRVHFELTPYAADLKVEESLVPLGKFLRLIAAWIREVYLDPAKYELSPDAKPFELVRVRRLAWLAGDDQGRYVAGTVDQENLG